MKKSRFFVPVFVMSLFLSACGSSPVPGTSSTEESYTEDGLSRSADPSNTPSPSSDDPSGASTEDGHAHLLTTKNNVIDHDPAGYCGNTVTTVSCHSAAGGSWEKSFWGDDSVSLTDLLRFLDYSEGICRCMPEYTVDTEFGQDYGINLTEGYVRHGDGQVSLTAEQLETIRDILERVSKLDE